MNDGRRAGGALLHIHVQVLGTGDDGSSPSLLLSVERRPAYALPGTPNIVLRRYLFNVGESTQRFCGETRIKLAPVSRIFLAGLGAEAAGLPGLALTLGGAGAAKLDVFGPSGVDGFVQSMKSFVRRRYPEITSTPLALSDGEAACSFLVEDEHVAVHCGVVDPAKFSAPPSRIDAAGRHCADAGADSSSDDSSSSDDDSSGSSCGGESSDGAEGGGVGSSSDSGSSENDSDSNGNSNAGSTRSGSHKTSEVGKSGPNGKLHGRKAACADGAADLPGAAPEKRSRVSDAAIGREESVGVPSQRCGPNITSDGPSFERTTLAAKGEPAAATAKASSAANAAAAAAPPPATGPPILLFRCDVKHGDRPSVLILSCQRVSAIPAVAGHSLLSAEAPPAAFVFHLTPRAIAAAVAYRPLFALPGHHVLVDRSEGYFAGVGSDAGSGGSDGSDGHYDGGGRILHRQVAEQLVRLHCVAPLVFPLHASMRPSCAVEYGVGIGSANGTGAAGAADAIAAVSNRDKALPSGSGIEHHDLSRVESNGVVVAAVAGSAAQRFLVAPPLLRAVLLPASSRGLDESPVAAALRPAEVAAEMEQRIRDLGLEGKVSQVRNLLAGKARSPSGGSDGGGGGRDAGGGDDCDSGDNGGLSGCGGDGGVSVNGRFEEDDDESNRRAAKTLRARLLCGARAESPTDGAVPGTATAAAAPPVSNHEPAARQSPAVNSSAAGPASSPPLARIWFLGTGCAAPSARRGCSGILLHVLSPPPPAAIVSLNVQPAPLAPPPLPPPPPPLRPFKILMDAGEGTYGSLERQFGRAGLLRELLALDCIWISHVHADHHTGLYRVLAERENAQVTAAAAAAANGAASGGDNGGGRAGANAAAGKQLTPSLPPPTLAPLPVIAPAAVLAHARACAAAAGYGLRFEGVRCDELDSPRYAALRARLFGPTSTITALQSVRVLHCHDAYGLVLHRRRVSQGGEGNVGFNSSGKVTFGGGGGFGGGGYGDPSNYGRGHGLSYDGNMRGQGDSGAHGAGYGHNFGSGHHFGRDGSFGCNVGFDNGISSGIRGGAITAAKYAFLGSNSVDGGGPLVYSGDTRPCDALVSASAGAELLIHEATFDDSMAADAVAKRHCTVGEAIDIGRRIGARCVVLTHFSQRYLRLPTGGAAAGGASGPAGGFAATAQAPDKVGGAVAAVATAAMRTAATAVPVVAAAAAPLENAVGMAFDGMALELRPGTTAAGLAALTALLTRLFAEEEHCDGGDDGVDGSGGGGDGGEGSGSSGGGIAAGGGVPRSGGSGTRHNRRKELEDFRIRTAQGQPVKRSVF